MSQIRLRQSQAGERLGRVDGRYVVEGVMQEQLKQVRSVCDPCQVQSNIEKC